MQQLFDSLACEPVETQQVETSRAHCVLKTFVNGGSQHSTRARNFQGLKETLSPMLVGELSGPCFERPGYLLPPRV